MGAWHEGIYGNDTAQDFLIKLSDLSKQTASAEELMDRLEDEDCFSEPEQQLIVADLEHSLFGTLNLIDNLTDAFEMLKQEALDCWVQPQKRIQALEHFEQRLTSSHPLTFEEIPNWIEARRRQDIFNTFGEKQVFDY